MTLTELLYLVVVGGLVVAGAVVVVASVVERAGWAERMGMDGTERKKWK